jgi:hypothetical protein
LEKLFLHKRLKYIWHREFRQNKVAVNFLRGWSTLQRPMLPKAFCMEYAKGIIFPTHFLEGSWRVLCDCGASSVFSPFFCYQDKNWKFSVFPRYLFIVLKQSKSYVYKPRNSDLQDYFLHKFSLSVRILEFLLLDSEFFTSSPCSLDNKK